ncbi:hypothetical protein BDW59DRAFT_150244 [Aspergillus cavernicola]|uniref:Uncharacterized protein n=1 Tax=Aspergillus cavernicola TaxID=176166 RepID=A0ABR4I0G1_9EURO
MSSSQTTSNTKQAEMKGKMTAPSANPIATLEVSLNSPQPSDYSVQQQHLGVRCGDDVAVNMRRCVTINGEPAKMESDRPDNGAVSNLKP